MKNIYTVFILLVTVILCFVFTACDRKNPEPDTTTTLADKTAAVDESTGTVPYSNDISSTTQPLTSERLTTVQKVTTSPITEKGTTSTTAAPSTTAATTVVTTAPPTTAPTTTAVPEEQTAAPTTTAPPETTVPFTNQSVPSIEIIEGEDTNAELYVIELVNKERIAAGLPALKVSNDLCKAASIRAEEISKEFSHVRPDGSLCFTVSPIMSAENIAKGQRTTQAVVSAWMNSDGHKKNILTKQFTITGVGCYYDIETDTYHWVQIFG